MKFKVFDKEKKEFVEEVHFVLTHGGILRSVASNIIHVCALSFTPIFSTGQKDIDGNEIYEGDIVKAHKFIQWNGDEIDKEFIGKIVWNNNATAEWAILTDESYYSFAETTHFEEPCIKIIGSTYTNPELLEE